MHRRSSEVVPDLSLPPCIYHSKKRWRNQRSCDWEGRGTLYFLRGFLYIICRKDQRSCDGQEGGSGGHNMKNYMTIRELYYTFAGFSKTGISLYNINFAERNS